MDNERPIEKLLRACAKKRRDDAGAPIELHPATRRMLQGEVSRQYRKSVARGPAWVQVFAHLRTRWIYAWGAIAVVAIGTVLLVPSLNKKNRSPATEGVRMNLAKNTLAPATVPPLDQLGPRNESPAPPAAPAASPLDRLGSRSSIHSQEVATVLTSNQPAAKPAPERRASAITEAESKMTTDTAQLAAFSNQLKTKTESATAEEASRTVFGKGTGSLALSVGEKRVGQTLGDMPVSGVLNRLAVQRFLRSNVGESLDKEVRAAKPDLAAPVLASFQIEQAGNRVRVIDNDGSVYTGSVEPVTTALAATAASPARFLAPAESGRLGGAGGGGRGGGRREINTRMADVVPAAPPQPAQRLYSFRVSGTNRTLQQPVVFMWNYAPLTNTPVALSQPATANAGLARDRALLDENRGEQRLGISGQVRLGEGKETAVEAAPAAP